MVSWPPGWMPAISVGSSIARAAYTAAVQPAGPLPRMMTLECMWAPDEGGKPAAGAAAHGPRHLESPMPLGLIVLISEAAAQRSSSPDCTFATGTCRAPAGRSATLWIRKADSDFGTFKM